MRSVMFMVLAVAACGASSAEIKQAKATQYLGDPGEIFDIVEATTAETYKIGETSRSGTYGLITIEQWYNPEGGRESSGAGDYVTVVDRSIRLQLVVELTDPEGKYHLVTVTPKTFQHISGSPQPRELAPDDPNLPGWVQGRVDSLYVEIHKRLQNYAVK